MMFIIRPIFHSLVKQADIEHRRGILSLLEANPGAKLLDLGCGNGDFTIKVAGKIGTNKISGIDIVESKIIEAREQKIEIHKADLNNKLPFADESFDIIIGNQVIEHLSDTDIFVREIHRVLKNGGYTIITTPNLAGIHNILFLLLGIQPPNASVSDYYLAGTWTLGEKSLDPVKFQPSHRRLFTLRALEEFLEYYGFEIDKSIGTEYFPLPTLLARVMCLIDKKHATHITVKARKKLLIKDL